jgi:hypothetical protein
MEEGQVVPDVPIPEFGFARQRWRHKAAANSSFFKKNKKNDLLAFAQYDDDVALGFALFFISAKCSWVAHGPDKNPMSK